MDAQIATAAMTASKIAVRIRPRKRGFPRLACACLVAISADWVSSGVFGAGFASDGLASATGDVRRDEKPPFAAISSASGAEMAGAVALFSGSPVTAGATLGFGAAVLIFAAPIVGVAIFWTAPSVGPSVFPTGTASGCLRSSDLGGCSASGEAGSATLSGVAIRGRGVKTGGSSSSIGSGSGTETTPVTTMLFSSRTMGPPKMDDAILVGPKKTSDLKVIGAGIAANETGLNL